jgi:hypothetical protein
MTLNIGAHIAVERLRLSKIVKGMKEVIEKLQTKKNVDATFVIVPLMTSTGDSSTKKSTIQTKNTTRILAQHAIKSFYTSTY